MVAPFVTAQDALDALDTTTIASVFVGGTTVEYHDWSAQFGVDQGIATARFTMSLPRPANVVANAVVEIQGGHNDLVGTLFSGRIPRWSSSMTRSSPGLTTRPSCAEIPRPMPSCSCCIVRLLPPATID